MLSFPNAKINLGLHVLRKREDGFHDIETVFYPVNMHDCLEIDPSPSGAFVLEQYGIPLAGDENLVTKAYNLLKDDFQLPAVQMHLLKGIPAGAGLGGGSSDAAHCLNMLNDMFNLDISQEKLQTYAVRLGSDCAFFIQNRPMLAKGRGEVLEAIDLDLSGKYIVIVKPEIHVSTPQAYSLIKTDQDRTSLREIITKPLSDWKDTLINDFEEPIFQMHPEIAGIKQDLYDSGALYAAMSGSGSAVFGLFDRDPSSLINLQSFTSVLSLEV